MKLLDRMAGLEIGVVGDLAVDVYVSGLTDRVSREAPVIVMRQEGRQVVPGCAANVARNLAALGLKVFLCGVVGTDQLGRELLEQLASAGVNVEGVVASDSFETVSKTRFVAGAKHTLRQHVLRVDCEPSGPLAAEIVDQVAGAVERIRRGVRAWMVSDYGYSCVDSRLKEMMADFSQQVPVVADSRYGIETFRGVSVIKPNEDEALAATGVSGNSDQQILLAASKLKQLAAPAAVAITLGNAGILVYLDEREYRFLPAVGTDQIVDLTGAGDTAGAMLAAALGSGGSYYEAGFLANCAASVVVMKQGCASASRDEVRAVLEGVC